MTDLCTARNGRTDIMIKCPYCKPDDTDRPQWIPVEKRLPRSMANKVIVYAQHEDLVSRIGYGHFERYKGTEIWYDLETDKPFSRDGYTVTHWMTMPKSPDGEKLILD